MFLCRSCLQRQALDLGRRWPRNNSTVPVSLGRSSRLDDLVILDTPKSTRKPKPKAKSRTPKAQAPPAAKIDGKTESRAESTVESGERLKQTSHKEVFEYLDNMKSKYQNQHLTPPRIKTLEKELKGGFTNALLKAYLRHSGVDMKDTKLRLTAHVLHNVWNITEKAFTVARPNGKAIVLPEEALHLLLAENGKLLQTWSMEHNVQLDVVRSEAKLIIHGRPQAVEATEVKLRKFLTLIESRTIKLQIPENWTIDANIMKATDSHILLSNSDSLQISQIRGQGQGIRAADRHLRTSMELHQAQDLLQLALPDSMPARHMPIYRTRTPLVEQRHRWTRRTILTTGVHLPFYYLTSSEPKPLKSSQVGARPSYPTLSGLSLMESGETLARAIAPYVGRDEVEASFGYVLQDHKAGATTFTTDIPGLFHALKNLEPGMSDKKYHRLTLTSADVADAIYIVPSIEEAGSTPMRYSMIKRATTTRYLSLPTQASDMRLSSSSYTELAPCQAINELLATCDFSKTSKVPADVEYDAKIWDVRYELTSYLEFHINEDLKFVWSKIWCSQEREKRQELRIVGSSKVLLDDIVPAIVQTMQALRKM